MADINIGSDQLLVTTLNENDRLIFTRAETGQLIASISIADFKKGICADFASLTKQKLPFELIGADGVKRDAFIRTFVGTVPSEKRIDLLSGVYSATLVTGFITSKLDEHQPPYILEGAANKAPLYQYYWTYGVGGGTIIVHDISSNYEVGSPFSFTFIFTEL